MRQAHGDAVHSGTKSGSNCSGHSRCRTRNGERTDPCGSCGGILGQRQFRHGSSTERLINPTTRQSGDSWGSARRPICIAENLLCRYVAYLASPRAATTAGRKGVSSERIQTLGRWESSAYLLYVRLPRDELSSVSKSTHCGI